MVGEFLLTFTVIGALLDLLQISEAPSWLVMTATVVVRWFFIRDRIEEYRYK
jgi:hypothetical protein